MTVAELSHRLSERELREWMAFAEIEPFGVFAEEQRTGIIAATVANSAYGRKKGARAQSPTEFMPAYRADQKALRQGEVERGEHDQAKVNKAIRRHLEARTKK